MEENKSTATGTENKVVTGAEENKQQDKLYTLSEAESMVDSRISKAYSKWEKQAAAKVTEAQKLAQMSAEEKASYEIGQREKAIVEKEKALSMQENRIEAAKVMAEKGISLSFLDYLVTDDADKTMENIKLFQKELAKNVEAEVRRRMASGTPKVGGNAAEVTAESFKKMSIAQRTDLYSRDKELYQKLAGGQ